jgi:hypothetical protein
MKVCCLSCVRERGDRAGAFPFEAVYMIVCESCSNKRCPHANDHRNASTGSNEPGQPGSAYAKLGR